MKFLYQSGFLIRVDRGQISIGKKNGQIVTAQHQPYLAGILLTNPVTKNACFLDNYNANVFLGELARIKGYAPKDYDVFQTALSDTVALFPEKERFPVMTIQDKDSGLPNAETMNRNALLMRIFAMEFAKTQMEKRQGAIEEKQKEEIV